jgi:uncharacterized membrane protein
MDQAVWNSSHGRILEATDEHGEITNRLKNHADFLLLAFVPLDWIKESPYWLLIVQAAVVGLGALPLYWLARRFLGREWPAALIAVAYLFNPGLQSANLFDFHAQMMAGTFLLFAFHYLLERRLAAFVLFAVLASLTKEGISLIVAMMGVYAVLALRRPRWGVPVFIGGVGYFLLVMLLLIPLFNAGDESRLVDERYEVLGGSLPGFVVTTLSSPLFVLEHALSGEKVSYLLHLTGYAGLLGLFSPAVLLIPLPEVAINLLSERPQMSNINYHYSATIIPFMYAAFAAGLSNLMRAGAYLGDLLPKQWTYRLPGNTLIEAVPLTAALWLCLFNVYLDYNKGPFSVSGFDNPVVMRPLPEAYIENLDEAVALIPEDAKVSASNWIGPHLAHRRHLYLFPVIKDAEYVVIDLARPSYYTGVDRQRTYALARNLLDDPEYRLMYSRDNVAVFERAREPGSKVPSR